ncbi:MAG: hypothetical protein K6L80_09790 [Agarilytica sp.]
MLEPARLRKVILMTDTSYTISIDNAYHTIDTLQQLLSSRQSKAKQSDLKEAISTLLGFETSNEMDAKINKHKERQQAQNVFDKRKRHKEVADLILKNTKNPLQLYDYFKKNRSFTTFIKFCEDMEVTGGYQFKCDDVLIAKDKYSALKMALNWDAIAQVEFKYWKDEGIEEYQDREGGYWELELIGGGDEQYLGSHGGSHICSSGDDGVHINSPDMPIEEVTRFFLDDMTQGDMPFFVDDREGFESYLKDVIGEYYGEIFSAKTEQAFIKHVEKFLPYLGIEEIVSFEVGCSPVSYLEILKEYGALFDSAKLLDQAVAAGDIAACHYLIQQGNSLENLYCNKWQERPKRSYFHDRACWVGDGDMLEDAKRFYITAKKIGVCLDQIDEAGCSPLHLAAKHGSDDLYEILVSLGANKDLKNSKGNTPEMILNAVRLERKRREESRISSSLFDMAFGGLFSDGDLFYDM